jgi:hypothetical protein
VPYNYQLAVQDESSRRLATGWLKLGILALLGSGAFSLLLVLSRTPGIHDMIPWVDFFHTALVVHVDLSVVIWFLAFAGVLWSINTRCCRHAWDWLALLLTAAGTLVIALAPFLGAGDPLLNNYIPVLQDPLFFFGGFLVAAGFSLLVLRSLATRIPLEHEWAAPDALRVGLLYSKVAALTAMLAFIASYLLLPESVTGQAYYEFLFWGGGHVLQFTHSLLLMVAWLWLAHASGRRVPLPGRHGVHLFGLAFAPVLLAPLIYIADPVFSAAHRDGFTELMRYGGLALLPLGLVVLISLFSGSERDRHQAPLNAALLSSLILFTVGGVLGFMIQGANVVIPAHYHGSIVGVTLAFMGMAYLLLPRLGFTAPEGRLPTWQPWIYGGGQLMHILGLAISGGYGNIQRKTAGAAQGLENLPEIAGMGLMGLGGLVSIIGGLLFLIVMIRALWFAPRPAA